MCLSSPEKTYANCSGCSRFGRGHVARSWTGTGGNLTEANKNVVRRAFQAFNQGDPKTLNEVFDAKEVLPVSQLIAC